MLITKNRNIKWTKTKWGWTICINYAAASETIIKHHRVIYNNLHETILTLQHLEEIQVHIKLKMCSSARII